MIKPLNLRVLNFGSQTQGYTNISPRDAYTLVRQENEKTQRDQIALIKKSLKGQKQVNQKSIDTKA